MAETKSTTIHKQLSKIQKELKAPKNQRNEFANFNYRSCEDILEAVKPLLNGLVLTIHDEIVHIDGRWYVKATARLWDGKDVCEVSAYAREADKKTGMDAAQVTGATSSYARKYALNGLFAIDDTKDADTQDNRPQKTTKKKTTTRKTTAKKTNKTPSSYPDKCDGCGDDVTPAVANYSERNYGKILCMVCQHKQNDGKPEDLE